jgi:ubiquinone/menaquinone biosynthesis C-methylase UbiE
MLIRLAVFLLEHSSLLRRLLWRFWYGRLAKQFTKADWTFMNYGYVPPDGTGPTLAPGDEPDRVCIQLYHRVVSPIDLAGRRVLEVGSGRGGGASYLARCCRPTHVTGADFSPQAVALCRQRHHAVANLDFLVGDAEHLPFPDASFDAVVNVESSHCYGDVAKFFAEAARVLRPGGYFLYTDFRAVSEMAALDALLAAQPVWEQVAHEDITAGVTAALEADDVRKRQLIAASIPPRFQPLFGEFAGLVGGQMHESFRTRKILYRRFAFLRR